MLLKQGFYCPPRCDVDHLGHFRQRYHYWCVDDEAIERSTQVTFMALEAFKSRKEAVHFRQYADTWEGYCFQRKILEEVNAEGNDMTATIFIGGNRVALCYMRRLLSDECKKLLNYAVKNRN